MQPVLASWIEVDKRISALIRAETGDDLYGHVLSRLRPHPNARMLSLGPGEFAREVPEASITCLNPNADLQAEEYDIVFCHGSLHNLVNLEHVVAKIAKSLRPGGVLIILDVCARNGYLMWPETREILRPLFKTLPARFRINHTAYGSPKVDEDIWEKDPSGVSTECPRTEEIVPILNSAFQVLQYVPYCSICQRLLDSMYGPNYDLSLTLDAAVLNWLWELDLYYVRARKLKPETFFGIYTKK